MQYVINSMQCLSLNRPTCKPTDLDQSLLVPAHQATPEAECWTSCVNRHCMQPEVGEQQAYHHDSPVGAVGTIKMDPAFRK